MHKINFLLSFPSQRIKIAELQKYLQLILFLFSVSLLQNHLHLQTSVSSWSILLQLFLLSLEVVPILIVGYLNGMRNHIPLATTQTLVWQMLKREITEEEEEEDAFNHFCHTQKKNRIAAYFMCMPGQYAKLYFPFIFFGRSVHINDLRGLCFLVWNPYQIGKARKISRQGFPTRALDCWLLTTTIAPQRLPFYTGLLIPRAGTWLLQHRKKKLLPSPLPSFMGISQHGI